MNEPKIESITDVAEDIEKVRGAKYMSAVHSAAIVTTALMQHGEITSCFALAMLCCHEGPVDFKDVQRMIEASCHEVDANTAAADIIKKVAEKVGPK